MCNVCWPSRGIASDVWGSASAIISENTERDRSIVTPETGDVRLSIALASSRSSLTVDQ